MIKHAHVTGSKCNLGWVGKFLGKVDRLVRFRRRVVKFLGKVDRFEGPAGKVDKFEGPVGKVDKFEGRVGKPAGVTVNPSDTGKKSKQRQSEHSNTEHWRHTLVVTVHQ